MHVLMFRIDEEIQLTALRWIDSFFEISPEDILQFVPRLLSQVLPALSSGSEQVCQAASRVNNSLMQYIVSLPEEPTNDSRLTPPPRTSTTNSKDSNERRGSNPMGKPPSSTPGQRPSRPQSAEITPQSTEQQAQPQPAADLDYAAAVNALTLQFLNENEATRVAALTWLIMLHRKAPRKVLAFHDGTFPALLKTLSDPAEAVVTRDLQLLSQISRNSEDSYFTSFMVNLLQLFSTDRKLLEVRGNLIIRQLCMNLSPERIYRTLADCLEKEEDIEFASIMVQNLNNNLITAPELADLRKRLRNLESKAYEQAYHLLQIFAELEMTVNMLIQIDKLVQLLESPVFTYLRLQLLEPEKYPYLYKCLYGVLMLLPQSSAFAALKNRLNSVSNIGLFHTVPRTPGIGGSSTSLSYERPTGRLKREESVIRWVDLLDKFKIVQERSRRSRGLGQREFESEKYPSSMAVGLASAALADSNSGREKNEASGGGAGARSGETGAPQKGTGHKARSSLGNFGRLSSIGQRKLKK
ncbi:vacuolar protein involved in phosphoinositide metabolism [Coccidioides immitis H538.4]|uniref:Vacuolar protein involved in phosphoinositide metabolism n=1 Tax=Coccidioides immitis H538.4 TaxID=396776 RepID=A0A0J8RVC3_COCIT|nr:vacuolar protein involved in phosphoinositide metabolism [Coccidioides immitis H538.4]